MTTTASDPNGDEVPPWALIPSSTASNAASDAPESSPPSTQAQPPGGLGTTVVNQPPQSTVSHSPQKSSISSTTIVASGSPPQQDLTTSSSTLLSSTQSLSPALNTGTTASRHSDDGISGGELAGAIVGAVFGAALISALITAFVCARKRRGARNTTGRGYGSGPKTGVPTGGYASSKIGEKTGSTTQWEAYLPQSVDDDTVRNVVRSFFDKLELHVDNYYKPLAGPVEEDAINAVSQIDSGRLPGTVAELVPNPQSTLPVLKHCVADVLLMMSSPGHQSQVTLLPARLAILPPKLLAPAGKARENDATRKAYSKWKQLNVYLFSRPEDDADYQQHRNEQAEQVAGTLTNVLAPWQSPDSSDDTVRHNFKGLAEAAANVGIMLASQPSEYVFRWSVGDSLPDGLVTSPALWKIGDEHGRPLNKPQVLVHNKVVRF